MRVEVEDGAVLSSSCECGGNVRKITTEKQYVMNGEAAGRPLATSTEYECATCGAKMALVKGDK